VVCPGGTNLIYAFFPLRRRYSRSLFFPFSRSLPYAGRGVLFFQPDRMVKRLLQVLLLSLLPMAIEHVPPPTFSFPAKKRPLFSEEVHHPDDGVPFLQAAIIAGKLYRTASFLFRNFRPRAGIQC